jgi:hypothetical protein
MDGQDGEEFVGEAVQPDENTGIAGARIFQMTLKINN